MNLNPKTRFHIRSWLPAIAYACLIFYVSSTPSQKLPNIGVDMSLLHVPEFLVLSYLIFRAFSMEIRASPMEKIIYWQIFVLAIIVSTLYGVTDEIHQLFVSGRQFSFFDMAFNFIGSSLILFKVWKK